MCLVVDFQPTEEHLGTKCTEALQTNSYPNLDNEQVIAASRKSLMRTVCQLFSVCLKPHETQNMKNNFVDMMNFFKEAPARAEP